LLEVALTILLLAGAVGLWSVLSFDAGLFFYALGWYGLGRFILEGTREEEDKIGSVSIYRVLSVVLMTVSLTFFFWRTVG
jgi:prolipoprotein diacylglyceryltransferase